MATFKEHSYPIGSLILDPNNYRFQDDPDFVLANPSRFHEPSVQDRAFRRLKEDDLLQLKNSILKNGFLPVERIVVRAYEHDGDKRLVVEGNRRIAVLMWIAQDHQAGVSIPEPVLRTIESVPVLEVQATDDDPAFFEAIMGVRHVSGVKEWGGFQRSKLVAVLKDQRGLESAEVGERLGMSTQEVNRRYRAFKALEQMLNDEDYGPNARPTMYPLFHEAVSLPAVREWLGWDDPHFRFDDAKVEQFYGLITRGESDEGETLEPKINTYSQVRELREILPIPESRRMLSDPSRTFLDALAIAKRDEVGRSWRGEVANAITALRSIGALEIKDLTDVDVAEITRLKDTSEELLSAISSLRG